MCYNIDAPNAGQTHDDRINWCSGVTMVIGCTVMLMIEMADRLLMDRIAWCLDVL
jgi:hypothetical protein